jgi:type VI secretion system protein ImpC
MSALVDEAMSGTVTWNKSLVKTIEQAITKLDEKLSAQLSTVMHDDSFKTLDGSWRGLDNLIKNTATSASMRVRMLQANKRELYKEMDKAPDYDQSILFKQVYDNEFGMAGGEPYGLLIGDYQFSNNNEDMELIRKISNVAAGAFCPVITAGDSSLLG